MKKKLTFFSIGENVFLKDIIPHLKEDYYVKIFHRGEEEEMISLLHDTDIAWFEWCDRLAILASQNIQSQKAICRLHSYEMFTDMPKHVNWGKINKLILVNEFCRDYSVSKFKIPLDKTEVVHNGINLDKIDFDISEKKGKKIAFIGFINYKKGPELLLQAWKAIWDYDHDFEFHIAGEHQDERIRLYFESIRKNLPFKIHMDGWVSNINEYLKDKDYVISTSLFESFQYSIAEGMANGCYPLVHSWVGSEIFYPRDFIWTFTDECVDIIRCIEENDKKTSDELRKNLRSYVEEKFPLEKQIKQIKGIIEGL